MRRNKKIWLCVLMLACVLVSAAQDYSKIDSLAKHLIKSYHIPGIAIIAVKENKVVYKKTFGKAQEELAFTDSMQIYIASNTKAFIGLAISKLEFENKLRLSDPISKHIPKHFFPEKIDIDKITVNHLLQHTHGLSNDPLVFRTAYSGDYPSDLRKLLKYTVYRNDTLSHTFKYSNLGYLLAGIIIEKLTGKSWQVYLKEHIFNAIGMNNTFPGMDFPPALEVLPFAFDSPQHLVSQKTGNTLHAAGGLYSTLDDMGRWLTVFTNDTQKYFDPELIKTYLNNKTAVGTRAGPFTMDEYAMGWIVGSFMDSKINYHFGSFPGYESMISYQPQNNTGIFVFVNEQRGGQRVAAMLNTYFYLVQSNDTADNEKIRMFIPMIEPLYKKPKETKPYYTHKQHSILTGTYASPRYGNLIVDKDAKGYSFRIGKLHSYVFSGEKKGEMLVEWTPGITERFYFKKDGNALKLIYGDFGEFTKL